MVERKIRSSSKRKKEKRKIYLMLPKNPNKTRYKMEKNIPESSREHQTSQIVFYMILKQLRMEKEYNVIITNICDNIFLYPKLSILAILEKIIYCLIKLCYSKTRHKVIMK